ncbi:hypothetical protein F5Y08DRAFT_237464 [Xylaria arbuscula]|nr:hypothetical protein F5Y08DRAFT_237464 [Xylaria arbuscula]
MVSIKLASRFTFLFISTLSCLFRIGRLLDHQSVNVASDLLLLLLPLCNTTPFRSTKLIGNSLHWLSILSHITTQGAMK